MTFIQGSFAKEIALDEAIVSASRRCNADKPTNRTEEIVLELMSTTLQSDHSELGIDMDFFSAGITSVDLIKLKSRICRRFGLTDIGIKVVISNNTVKLLSKAVDDVLNGQVIRHESVNSYEPVVALKAFGDKTPLWLIHPGVGEVLVFIGLSQHVQGRPVYALRARGFEPNESNFKSIDEAVDIYVEAIRSRQPFGPYAIAGYSYGSMLAFEIGKRLEADGRTVGFLGRFNLPPHIKTRMRQLKIQHCLLHLALFLQLIDEPQLVTLEVEGGDLPIESVFDLVHSASDISRWQQLDLTRSVLLRWAHVAYSLQSMAVDYDPSGSLRNIDVFYCDPLSFAARSREEWLEGPLSQWQDFSRTLPRFHSVKGGHYSMLSAINVQSFQKTLEGALTQRGL